jgi:putative transposase
MASPFAHDKIEKLGDYHDRNDYERPEEITWKFRRQTDGRELLAASLHFFDGDRYELTDFVVMPNHVHVLATFPDEGAMLRQCESWKHFMATKINRCLGRTGRFWQQDAFDHLVRSTEQFAYLRKYIAENPKKANLHPGEYVVYSSRGA